MIRLRIWKSGLDSVVAIEEGEKHLYLTGKDANREIQVIQRMDDDHNGVEDYANQYAARIINMVEEDLATVQTIESLPKRDADSDRMFQRHHAHKTWQQVVEDVMKLKEEANAAERISRSSANGGDGSNPKRRKRSVRSDNLMGISVGQGGESETMPDEADQRQSAF